MMTPVLEIDYGKLLNEARQAYHTLNMGQAARVYVDQNGERVEYQAANAARLVAYIQQLETKCGIGSGGAPLNVWM